MLSATGNATPKQRRKVRRQSTALAQIGQTVGKVAQHPSRYKPLVRRRPKPVTSLSTPTVPTPQQAGRQFMLQFSGKQPAPYSPPRTVFGGPYSKTGALAAGGGLALKSKGFAKGPSAGYPSPLTLLGLAATVPLPELAPELLAAEGTGRAAEAIKAAQVGRDVATTGRAAEVLPKVEKVAAVPRGVKAVRTESSGLKALRAQQAEHDAMVARNIERAKAASKAAGRPASLARDAKVAAARNASRLPPKLEARAKNILPYTKARVKNLGYSITPKGLVTGAKLKAIAVPATAAGAGIGGAAEMLAAGAANTAQAVRHNPLQVAGTTARTAEAIPSAFLQIPQAGVQSVTEGSVAPLKGVAGQYLSYLKTVGQVAGPHGQQVVENKVGLIPALTIGAGGAVALRGARSLLSKDAPAEDVAKLSSGLEKLRQKAIDPAIIGDAHDAAQAKFIKEFGKESRRTAKKARIRESQRAAFATRSGQGQGLRELRTTVGRVDKTLAKLSRRKVGSITEGHIVTSLASEGLYGMPREAALTEIRKRLATLEKPSRVVPPNAASERLVYQTVLAHPDVLDSPLLQKAPVQLGELKAGRVKQGEIVHSEVARMARVARAENIRLPHERMPPELVGKTNIKEAPGKIMEDAIRKQGEALKKRAETALRSARRAEAQAVEARRYRSVGTGVQELSGLRANLRQAERQVEIAQSGFAQARATLANRIGKGTGIEAARRAVDAARVRAMLAAEDLAKRRREYQDAHRAAIEQRATELKRKAAELRRASAKLNSQAEEHLSAINHFTRANSKDIQAYQIEAGLAKGARAKADPAALRAEAAALRLKGQASQDARTAAFMTEAQSAIARKEYSQPVKLAEKDIARENQVRASSGYSRRMPGKTKFSRGILAKQGRVVTSPQTLLDNIVQERAAIAKRGLARSFIGERAVPLAGTRFFTEDAGNTAIKAGKLPPGGALVDPNEFVHGLQPQQSIDESGFLNDTLKAQYEAARLKAKALGGGKVVMYVDSKAAYDQLRAQMQPIGGLLRTGRLVARLQNTTMIATSPAWFIFQLFASPSQALYVYGPRALAAEVKTAVATYHGATPFERQNLNDWYGATTSSAVTVTPADLATAPEQASAAMALADRSPVGRFIHGLGRYVSQKGGPLIQGNRAFEAQLRKIVGSIEFGKVLSKESEAKVRAWAESTARLDATVRDQIAKLGKVPAAARAAYLADHPELGLQIEKGLNDALGSWDAFTSRERVATALFPFYPFLRFSYRWMTTVMPNTPIRAAVIANMAQSNAVAFQTIIGGKPSSFTDYGTLVTYPNGQAALGPNLARAMPGGNAVLEAIGSSGQKNLLATATAPFEPLFSTAATAAAGQSSFGTPSTLGFPTLMGKGVLGLSPFTRGLGQSIGQSEASKLFQRIQGSGSLRYGLTPHLVPHTLTQERDLVLASHLYQVLSDTSTAKRNAVIVAGNPKQAAQMKKQNDKAQKELQALLNKYGLGTAAKASQKKISRSFSKYDQLTNPSSGGGLFPTIPTPTFPTIP